MRRFCGWIGVILAGFWSLSLSAAPLRLVSLDWAAAETAIALGVPPVGMAQVRDYRIWSGPMPMPATVVDVGLRMEPNLELLASLKPDLILISPLQAGLSETLSRIAPVRQIEFNRQQQPDSLLQGIQATRTLAGWLERPAAGEALIARTQVAIQTLARQVKAGGRPRPVYLLRLADRRHGWVLGERSLFGSAAKAAGIPLAWQGETNLWGFASVPLTALMAEPAAVVMPIAPWPFADLHALDSNRLWQALPAIQAGRLVPLDPVWLGNGLPSLLAFCQQLQTRWSQQAVELSQPQEMP